MEFDITFALSYKAEAEKTITKRDSVAALSYIFFNRKVTLFSLILQKYY